MRFVVPVRLLFSPVERVFASNNVLCIRKLNKINHTITVSFSTKHESDNGKFPSASPQEEVLHYIR